MTPERNIKHGFNLAGLKAGDSFLGCPRCWFRLEPHEAAVPICPDCLARMNLYDVTPEDVMEPKQ